MGLIERLRKSLGGSKSSSLKLAHRPKSAEALIGDIFAGNYTPEKFSLEKSLFGVLQFIFNNEVSIPTMEKGIRSLLLLGLGIWQMIVLDKIDKLIPGDGSGWMLFGVLSLICGIVMFILALCEERVGSKSGKEDSAIWWSVFSLTAVMSLSVTGFVLNIFIFKLVGLVWLGRLIFGGLNKYIRGFRKGERDDLEVLREQLKTRAKGVIGTYRSEVLSGNSEFGKHLAAREAALDRVLKTLAHWEKRNKNEVGSDYLKRRLDLARETVRLIEEDIKLFRKDKDAVLADLRELEEKIVPQVETEIQDNFYDRELDELSEAAEGYRAESEILMMKSIARLGERLKGVNRALEALRLRALPVVSGRSEVVVQEVS